MIFFTVGTEQFPFQRMIDAADLVAQALPDEEVFIQIADNIITSLISNHLFLYACDHSSRLLTINFLTTIRQI